MHKKLIERISRDEDSSFKKGASERQIALAEKQLGLKFPPSYRQFLRHFNGGEFRFGRMYRISRSGAGFFDLQEQMANALERIPGFRDRQLLIFADDYSGNYCFDMSKTGIQGERPVVLVMRGMKPEAHSRSLQSFIRKGLAIHD